MQTAGPEACALLASGRIHLARVYVFIPLSS